MQPQRMNEQTTTYTYMEPPYQSTHYQQAKLKAQRQRGVYILNAILQTIIIFLSLLYFMSLPDSGDYQLPMAINLLLINSFFFIIVNLVTRPLPKTRRILFICFLFISTIILFFASLILIINANTLGGLLIVWPAVILIDTIVYWLARLIPPITI